MQRLLWRCWHCCWQWPAPAPPEKEVFPGRADPLGLPDLPVRREPMARQGLPDLPDPWVPEDLPDPVPIPE